MKIAKDKGYNNAGGGVYNHDMFWQAMAPKGKGGAPSAALAAAIDKSFGSMDKMKEEWEALAAPASTFGSGWVWLYVKGKDLKLGNTPNQDNPLMKGANIEGIPILGIDVWEHAFTSASQVAFDKGAASTASTPRRLFANTGTTSSTRTAARSTSRPSGTSSTGTRCRSGTTTRSPARRRSSRQQHRPAPSPLCQWALLVVTQLTLSRFRPRGVASGPLHPSRFHHSCRTRPARVS